MESTATIATATKARHGKNDTLQTTINKLIQRSCLEAQATHKRKSELLNAGIIALKQCETLESLEQELRQEIKRIKQERAKGERNGY